MGLFGKNNKLENDYKLLLDKYKELEEKYNKVTAECEELRNILSSLKNERTVAIDKFSLEYINELNASEFIDYTRYILGRLAYNNVDVINTNDDLKVDLLAEKDNFKYVVRCKLSSDLVNSDIVREAYEGKKYCGRNVAIVITNSRFSDGAIELSKDTGVVLWDKEVLLEMLTKVKGLTENEIENGEEDPLYDEVVKFVVEYQKASASLLQRKFKLGYNRAARLIDLLEERGIIGQQNGSSPRVVLKKNI